MGNIVFCSHKQSNAKMLFNLFFIIISISYTFCWLHKQRYSNTTRTMTIAMKVSAHFCLFSPFLFLGCLDGFLVSPHITFIAMLYSIRDISVISSSYRVCMLCISYFYISLRFCCCSVENKWTKFLQFIVSRRCRRLIVGMVS
jgi:hypothetical protein